MRACFVFKVRPCAPSKCTSISTPMHKTDALGYQPEYIIHSSIEKDIIFLMATECVQQLHWSSSILMCRGNLLS